MTTRWGDNLREPQHGICEGWTKGMWEVVQGDCINEAVARQTSQNKGCSNRKSHHIIDPSITFYLV